MPAPVETIEDAIEGYLQTAVDNAAEDDILHGAAVKDDYETLTENDEFGYIIGECAADVAPMPGGAMGEFDALVVVVCFARVAGQDKTARKPARMKARALMLRAAKLFSLDPMMGGTVRDSRLLRCRRGFDTVSSADAYAVAHMPLIVNETGQQVDVERRIYE